MINSMYGMHAYDKDINAEDIERLSSRMNIPPQRHFYVKEKYYDHVSGMHQPNERFQQALLQPMQLRYFDKTGTLEALLVNCDVGGFPNLKWENFNVLDSIPINSPILSDSLWSIQDEMQFVGSYDGGTIPLSVKAEHQIHMFWSYRMGRQAVRLKRLLDKLQQREQNQLEVFYFNIDSLYQD